MPGIKRLKERVLVTFKMQKMLLTKPKSQFEYLQMVIAPLL